MEGKTIQIKGFKAVGVSYFGDNNKGEIPKLWEVFNTRYGEIKNKDNPSVCYGVCYDAPDAEGRFDYMACTSVENFGDIPEGMETKIIPDGKYLVFTFGGSLSELGDFYGNIFSKWLPTSGCEMDCRPQLELYDGRYMDNGEFDVYIPVK